MATKKSTPRRSPLGLIVLWQLVDQPMHVYRMQKLLEAQGKDQVVNLRSRASLYQTIERLVRDGLVHVAEIERHEGYPDRTVYAITDTGEAAAHAWLREMLSSTDNEYPEFIAALSILFGLAPDEAQAELELRAQRLAAALARATATLTDAPAGLPRLFLLEEEYRQAMLTAELTWIRAVIEDLRAGRLTWSQEWLREIAAAFIDEYDDPNHEDR